MKLDAEIKITASTCALIPVGSVFTIPVDENYVENYDELINTIISELYYRNGRDAAIYGTQFDILNEDDLMADLFG